MVLLFFALSALPLHAQGGIKTITNGIVSLSYKTGGAFGLKLISVGDFAEPEAFALKPGDNIWSITFLNPATKQKYVVIPSLCTSVVTHFKTGSEFHVIWHNCTFDPGPGEPALPVFDVVAHVACPTGASVAEFTISIAFATGPSAYAMEQITYPRIRFEERAAGTAQQAELAWPRGPGSIVLDPVHNTFVFPSPAGNVGLSPSVSMSMQFLSYYERSEYAPGSRPANLFMGTRDLEGCSKAFYLGPASPDDPLHPEVKESFPINLVTWPEDNRNPAVDAYTMSFPFVLGVIRGDWHDACKSYRQWVLESGAPWITVDLEGDPVPMENNASFPSHVKNAKAYGEWSPTFCKTCPDVNAIDRSSWAHLLARVAEQNTRFELGGQVAMRINHWESYSFTGNVGEWLPMPVEFAEAAFSLKDAGYAFHCYFNGNTYSQGHPTDPDQQFQYPTVIVPRLSCTGAPPIAHPYNIHNETVVDEDGLLKTRLSGAFKRRTPCPLPGVLGSSCGCPPTADCSALSSYENHVLDQRSDFVHDYMTYYAQLLTELGSHGFYLDAYINLAPELSYNTGFPKGGGPSWTIARIQNMRDLKALVCDNDFYVDSEGNQEVYIKDCHTSFDRNLPEFDRLDGDGNVRQITAPLFQTVYHEYHITADKRAVAFDFPDAAIDDYQNTRRARQLAAVALYYGNLPGFGGDILSEDLDATMDRLQLLHSGAPSNYERYVLMQTNFLQHLTEDSVRSFTVFGERVRDPRIPSINGVPLRLGWETDQIDSGAARAQYLPDGRDNANPMQSLKRQPYVYVSAFRRLEGVGASRPSLGILMLNWTYASDALPPGAEVAYIGAGAQTLGIEIDPVEYGLTGNYELVRIKPDGVEVVVDPLVVFGTNPYQHLAEGVQEGRARFLVFRPI